MNEQEFLYKKAEQRYIKGKISFDEKELHKIIDNLCERAKKNYLKFSKPRTCSRKVYVSIWIYDEVVNDIARKGVGKPIRLDNPPPEYKATADFLCSYPLEMIEEIRKKRNEIWNTIDFQGIKEKWLAVVRERNNFSSNKGYYSRVAMYLDTLMIPKTEYKRFLNNVDNVISYINCQIPFDFSKYLEQQFSRLCFICGVQNFPFKNTTELLNFFRKKYPILDKNKDKIRIKLAERSEAKYVKEKDCFEITLEEKIGVNHQLMDLIHELAHVVCMLESFERDDDYFWKSKYEKEKSAIDIELDFIKKYFPELFLAKLGYILQTFHQILFEIEIYQNPDEDPDILYVECLNRCFGTSQKVNRGYLLMEGILYRSFSELVYAVAYTNSLLNFL